MYLFGLTPPSLRARRKLLGNRGKQIPEGSLLLEVVQVTKRVCVIQPPLFGGVL